MNDLAPLVHDADAAAGTWAFLFTDLVGSTRLWEERPDEMQVALARHDTLLSNLVAQQGGLVFKSTGDGAAARFFTVADAVVAARDIQTALLAEPWPGGVSLTARAAVHVGAAQQRAGDYFGPSLNRTARLMAAGHGGQTLLSQAAYELCRDALPEGSSLIDLGLHRLKDLARPEQVWQLCDNALPATFPPLRTLDNLDLPNNLPQQLTSFVGREKELTEIIDLLSGSRLVTLVGAGEVVKRVSHSRPPPTSSMVNASLKASGSRISRLSRRGH